MERFELPPPIDRTKQIRTPEDVQIWRSEVKDVAPLYPSPHIPPKPLPKPERITIRHQASGASSLTALTTQQPNHEHAFDTNILRRIKQQKLPIERTLDLHDMTQASAHETFRHFIIQCAAQRIRLVLVITGKGGVRHGGVLRNALPHWCAATDISPYIIGFHPSQTQHGGQGAWYIRIRRHG